MDQDNNQNKQEVVVSLSDISKTFRDFWLRPTVKAVDRLNLNVKRGEIFGLLGPNGSGKSTTIKMILGLLKPGSGEIRLFGKAPTSAEARAKLGYLPELSYLHPFMTARETLDYYAGLCSLPKKIAKERSNELLEMTGLQEAADRPVGGFSKGMARRVALASSLIGKPELLVLDEPTSGLDPVSTDEVKTLIKTLAKGGMTILMSSHLLADAQDVCSSFMILNHGKTVAEGRVGQINGDLGAFFLSKVGEGRDFKIAPFLCVETVPGGAK
ncbi:MAG: ABC transporter ATP-binding protein [Kiritimatiellae bacterium]|nr:ABC transporter ATP-binding protein [Kiritimatiellia bacterium]